MQLVNVVTVFALLLTALCGCEESLVRRQSLTARADGFVPNPPPDDVGGYTHLPGGQSYPTIVQQTFIPSDPLFAHTKCLTWRIEWPNYPAGTDPNTIPTVFRLSNGSLYSFGYLNGLTPSNTYKTNFNLFHNAQLETASTLWDELIHTFGNGEYMESTWFNETSYSAKTIEGWVKERPGLFEEKWVDNNQQPPVYQQGDIFLFKLLEQNRYGGIRIVSMTPRIIEVYLAVPNN